MLPRSAVRWVEAQGDYARLHTADGSHLVRVPLATLAERWADAGFVRIHRSYLVQLRLIAELRLANSGYVVVVDGTELPVSRRHTRELKDKLVRAAKNGLEPLRTGRPDPTSSGNGFRRSATVSPGRTNAPARRSRPVVAGHQHAQRPGPARQTIQYSRIPATAYACRCDAVVACAARVVSATPLAMGRRDRHDRRAGGHVTGQCDLSPD